MKVSYLVALKVALATKSHTMAGNLIFPTTIDM